MNVPLFVWSLDQYLANIVQIATSTHLVEEFIHSVERGVLSVSTESPEQKNKIGFQKFFWGGE